MWVNEYIRTTGTLIKDNMYNDAYPNDTTHNLD